MTTTDTIPARYTNADLVRTYRGWTIRKTDTGGRRMGREVWYVATDANGRTRQSPLLKGVKAIIDILEGQS